MLPARRKFAICKPLGLSSIRNDTSSAPAPPYHPLAPRSSSRSSSPRSVPSYEPAKQLQHGFTGEISPAATRCSNKSHLDCTSQDALTRIKLLGVEEYGVVTSKTIPSISLFSVLLYFNIFRKIVSHGTLLLHLMHCLPISMA